MTDNDTLRAAPTLNRPNPKIEYGFHIGRRTDGGLFMGDIQRGMENSMPGELEMFVDGALGLISGVPKDSVPFASVHSHPRSAPGDAADGFSSPLTARPGQSNDIDTYNKGGLVDYLVTGDGRVLRYDPATKAERLISVVPAPQKENK